MKRRSYAYRSFPILSKVRLQTVSDNEISDYITNIETRSKKLLIEYKNKTLGVKLARETIESRKSKNIIELTGVVCGAGFYFYDPTFISTIAFFGFALPIVIATKIMNRHSNIHAKTIALDIISLEKELKSLDVYKSEALAEIKNRQG